jgi:hypothetical protein
MFFWQAKNSSEYFQVKPLIGQQAEVQIVTEAIVEKRQKIFTHRASRRSVGTNWLVG